MSAPEGRERRAIPQRSSQWASRAADLLARARLTPNQLSVGSVLVSVAGAGALLASADAPDGARAALLIVAAVCAPVRLLLNMLDGMLAVEKGLRSPTGELFNEVPDRIADVVFLAAAGYAAGMPALGWTAASLALLTAYVRTLGAAQGVGNFFDGPMAKPRRMWVLVVACLVSPFEPVLGDGRGAALGVGLALISVGSSVTVVVRLQRIASALRGSTGGTP